MADNKKEGKQYDPSTIKPGDSKKDEISQEELSKVSAGSGSNENPKESLS